MDHSTTTLFLSLVVVVVVMAADRAGPFFGGSFEHGFIQRVTTERRPRVIITPSDMDFNDETSSRSSLAEEVSSVTSLAANDTFGDDLAVNDSRLLAALDTLAHNVQQEQELSSKLVDSTATTFITDPSNTSPECNGSDPCFPTSHLITSSISNGSSQNPTSPQPTAAESNLETTTHFERSSENPRQKDDDDDDDEAGRSPWQEAYERWLQRYTEALAAYENTYGFNPPAELPQAFQKVPDLSLVAVPSKDELNISHGEGFHTEFFYNVRGPGSNPGGSLVRLVNASSQSILPSVLWSESDTFDNSVDDQNKPKTNLSTDQEDPTNLWFNLSPDTSEQTSTSRSSAITESSAKPFTYTPAWIKDLETTEPPEIGRSNAGKRRPVLVLTAPKCTRPGQDLNLACLLKRTPDLLPKNLTLTWKKIDYIGGTARPLLLSENSSLKVVDYRLSLEKAPDMTRLRLWNISYQDTGIYQCEASMGETAFQTEVTVRMCE